MSTLKRWLAPAADRVGLLNALYRLHQWRHSRTDDPPPATDDDGVPLPSAYLMQSTVGTTDWRWFLDNGAKTAHWIADAVSDTGTPFRELERILDMGCGCGRVIRHMPALTDAELYGVDYNPRLVKWCANNLAGVFTRNHVTPPLAFADDTFDMAYLLSVFTHLRPETQELWLDELRRVIRPGGFVLITFHDEHHGGLQDANLTKNRLLDLGDFVFNDQLEGSNLMAAFLSIDAARARFSKYFDVVGLTPSNQVMFRQAAAVLRAR